MELAPLVGFKALRAFNAFHTLLLGLKMLPAYFDQSYEKFFESFRTKSEAEREKFLREAVAFVPLDEAEILAFCSFGKDRNGIPYSRENVGNLGIEEMNELIVRVCMEIGRLKVDFVTESEKKNLNPVPST